MSLHNISGYELISEQGLEDINSKGYIYKHIKTGARVCCISNDDENKVFYIGFRTPPNDSTGVAHINEHSVLCGSKKFPAKDPFVELAKGSLNTFLNAMTYPDKTVYPIASCNNQDFKNLCDVYLDAVFYPNIYSREEIFKQEGWHYELNDKSEDITLNGVVYSEMKGAFSSPDDVFDRYILDSLFPDNCYGVESGGDPDVIPQLTYEQFLDFHRKYYHPSNSYIYLYGDLDIKEQLEYIDREYLDKFDELTIDSSIKMQESFEEIRYIDHEYSITNDEPLEDNTYMAYNTVIDTSLNEKLYIAFQVIDYALVSAPGAILKQTLLDKGLCKDVDSTYDNGVLQPYYSIIMRNTNESVKDDFLKTIEEVLKNVVKEGFDKKALKASLNLLEFKFREADFGHYPKGLMYGLQALDSWLYDDNKPFIHITALDTFEFLKNQIDTDYFEKLVEKYLLNNKHKTMVTMVPRRGLTALKEKKLSDQLKEYKDSLSDDEIAKLIEETKALHKYQEEPDSDEILDMIPLLKISDIKREARKNVYKEHIHNGVKYLTHDVFTGGIGYLSILYDITGIDDEWLPYVGILKNVLGLVDTKQYAYKDLVNEIFLNSGGIAPSTELVSKACGENEYILTFEMKGKVLYSQLPFAFDMIRQIVNESNFTDKKRMRELICTLKSRVQASMMNSGHIVSSHRALSHVSRAEEVIEKINGIEMYRLVENLERDFDGCADDFIDKLENVSRMIFTKSNLLLIDYTATNDQYERLFELGEEYVEAMGDGIDINDKPKHDFVVKGVKEAFKTSAKVQYVAKAGRYMDDKHPYTGALKVLKVIMGYDYLWNQVRVQGGAYGAFATFYRAGDGCFSSYRDPNLSNTLKVYENAVEYIKKFDANKRDMTKYIIGTIADLDVPMPPQTVGAKGLDAYLSEFSDEQRQLERDEVLNCTKETIRGLASYIANLLKTDSICVLGGEEKIEEEKDIFDSIAPLIQG